MRVKHSKKSWEICNECGKSVAFGYGLFVNRVLDLNDYPARKEMGKPFPKGNFICADCEDKINDLKEPRTEGEWICNDIDAVTGELLIQNEAGKLIGEVYNKEDVPLIKSAPDLLKALQKLCDAFPLNKMNIQDNFSEILIHNQALKTIKKAHGQ